MDITTARTRLRCMAWVNGNDCAATLFRLIHQEVTQAIERPLMHGAALFSTILLCCISDVCQVLNHDCRTRSYALNQLPTDHVIAIQAKPRDFVRELPEMSLRTVAAFALKGTLQPEIPTFRVFPGTLTKKLIVRGHSGTGDPEVNTDHFPVRNELHLRQSHHQMQPEPAFTKDQVCTVEFNTLLKQSLCIRVQMQGYHLPASRRRQRNRILMKSIGALVIPNRTIAASRTSNRSEGGNGFPVNTSLGNLFRKLPFAFHLPGESRLDRFGRFHSGRDHQLRGQLRIGCSQGVIGCFMQLDPILLSVLPTINRHGIEAIRVLLNSFKQHIRLFCGGQQGKADGSLHKTIVAQIF